MIPCAAAAPEPPAREADTFVAKTSAPERSGKEKRGAGKPPHMEKAHEANAKPMAEIRKPLPVKLFVGILTSAPTILPTVEERLSELFGPVDSRSDSFPFDMTHYYDQEMGVPISRNFLSFEKLINPSEITEIKVKTNDLESALARENPVVERPVNLDPGYLEQSKIVLASTKNYFHRVLISGGIYAEVTLHFEEGEWRAFPWTFPDYKSGRYDRYFSSLRDLYRRQLSAAGFRIRTRRRE